MGLFNLFNKKPKVVWRNEKGQVQCPGDSCPQKCDDTCPIWCQTKGLTMLLSDKLDRAITEFEKAIEIAPDYKEAWCNMGNAYGTMNNHKEACQRYQRAYDLDNRYDKAIYGLVISYKNLGQFTEALALCDKLEAVAGKSVAQKARQKVNEAQKEKTNPKSVSDLEMLVGILAYAREIGLLGKKQGMPLVPEIMVQRKVVCTDILSQVFSHKNIEEPDRISLLWCFYAGVGAIIHGRDDMENLQEIGIMATLTAPRGFDSMDEYVLDAIGVDLSTDEGKQFKSKLDDVVYWIMIRCLYSVKGGDLGERLLNALQASFLLGNVFEMERYENMES